MAFQQIQLRRNRGRAIKFALSAVLGASLVAFSLNLDFIGTSGESQRRRLHTPLKYDSGKVNSIEITYEAMSPPMPVLECSESCMTAIFECLDEGCSVEAMQRLDKELAEDEAKIQKTRAELQELKKKSVDDTFQMETQGTLAWLDNFLSRSGALRAQLIALTHIDEQDHDFVKQMVKAASYAFGGSPGKGDYPKAGVAPYSE